MNNPRSIFTNSGSFNSNIEPHQQIEESYTEPLHSSTASEITSHPTSAPSKPSRLLGSRPSLSIPGLRALCASDGLLTSETTFGQEKLESRSRSVSDPEGFGDIGEGGVNATREPVVGCLLITVLSPAYDWSVNQTIPYAYRVLIDTDQR